MAAVFIIHKIKGMITGEFVAPLLQAAIKPRSSRIRWGSRKWTA